MALVAVPPGVVTETLCNPLPAGVTAVMDRSDCTTTLVAATPPTLTLVAPVKFFPIMAMLVPPRLEPVAGETEVMVGGVFAKLNAKGNVADPPAVFTITARAAPEVPAGVTAVIVVAFTTTTLVAATDPMVTLLAPNKLVPVMVTGVPPAVGPLIGKIHR